MTNIEERLQYALEANDVPRRDPMLRLAIIARRERAGFRRKILTATSVAWGIAFLSASRLWWTGQVTDFAVLSLATLAIAGIILTLWLSIASGFGPRAKLRRWCAISLRFIQHVPGLRPWF